jgi:hypothetical protein
MPIRGLAFTNSRYCRGRLPACRWILRCRRNAYLAPRVLCAFAQDLSLLRRRKSVENCFCAKPQKQKGSRGFAAEEEKKRPGAAV